jgi:hypothetical protein
VLAHRIAFGALNLSRSLAHYDLTLSNLIRRADPNAIDHHARSVIVAFHDVLFLLNARPDRRRISLDMANAAHTRADQQTHNDGDDPTR